MTTLTDEDATILETLEDANRSVDAIAAELDRDPDALDDRLQELHDNGLVHAKGEGWSLTRDGRNLLRAPGDGSADDRIDTPEEVEAAIQSFQVRPDRTDAIRAAFAYLRHWDEATAGEIAADVYDEHPAGYPEPDEWWEQFVREYLAELPGVQRPDDGETWRYDETAGDGGTAARDDAASTDRQNGREVDLDEPTDPRGGLKHALETLDASDAEREAVLAAATLLRERTTATEDELAAAAHVDHDADYETPEALWEGCLRPAFESLPEIERRGERRWRHAGADAEPGVGGATDADAKTETDADTQSGTDAGESVTGAAQSGTDADAETETADDDVCPVCGKPSAGRSVHLGGETIVPSRRSRSCVRATQTDGAAAITIYYHDRERG